MNKSLKAKYPGIHFPEDWNNFLDESDIYEYRKIIENKHRVVKSQYPNAPDLPAIDKIEPDRIVDYFTEEKYAQSNPDHKDPLTLTRFLYYAVRPFLSVRVRSKFQKYYLKNWDKIKFPGWPIDTTADDIMDFFFMKTIEKNTDNCLLWYWPGEYTSCVVITHDIETTAGLENCSKLMELEEKYNIRSSFEVVPEKRYKIDKSLLKDMSDRGFEICIHGLTHDGSLFNSREQFTERKDHIRKYAEEFGARGFRSPVMYRNVDMIRQLNFDYDMSFPNTAHLDPQRGGCCTIFPFFNGNTLEIPLTTIQDYSLLYILKTYDIGTWKNQIKRISSRSGVISFIIHPDYMLDRKSLSLYEDLLKFISSHNDLWLTTPGELNDWWRQRARAENIDDLSTISSNKAYSWNPIIKKFVTGDSVMKFDAFNGIDSEDDKS